MNIHCLNSSKYHIVVGHPLLVGQVGHGWATAMVAHQKDTLKQWLIKSMRWAIVKGRWPTLKPSNDGVGQVGHPLYIECVAHPLGGASNLLTELWNLGNNPPQKG